MTEHLPGPSVWPCTIGAGITLMAFGVVSSLVFTAIGVVLLIGGLAGWIGELRHG
jgi:hypothetical protein